MKKISLHIDAWIVIVLLFVISFAFNFYQRYQYSDLLRAHIELQGDALRLDYAVSFLRVSLDNCKNGNIIEH